MSSRNASGAVPLIHCDFNSSCPGGHPIRCAKDHNGNEIALHEGMKIIVYQSDGLPDEAGEFLSGYMIYRGTARIREDWDATKGPGDKWFVACDHASESWVESFDAISPKWIHGTRNNHHRPRAKQGSLIETYRNRMIGLPLRHSRRGDNSTLFLEFGELTPATSGSPAHPKGQYSVMFEHDWRIEHQNSILCKSANHESEWPDVFQRLDGRKLESLLLLSGDGNLSVVLSGEIEISSSSLRWKVFDNAGNRWICIKGNWWAAAEETVGSEDELA